MAYLLLCRILMNNFLNPLATSLCFRQLQQGRILKAVREVACRLNCQVSDCIYSLPCVTLHDVYKPLHCVHSLVRPWRTRIACDRCCHCEWCCCCSKYCHYHCYLVDTDAGTATATVAAAVGFFRFPWLMLLVSVSCKCNTTCM